METWVITWYYYTYGICAVVKSWISWLLRNPMDDQKCNLTLEDPCTTPLKAYSCWFHLVTYLFQTLKYIFSPGGDTYSDGLDTYCVG